MPERLELCCGNQRASPKTSFQQWEGKERFTQRGIKSLDLACGSTCCNDNSCWIAGWIRTIVELRISCTLRLQATYTGQIACRAWSRQMETEILQLAPKIFWPPTCPYTMVMPEVRNIPPDSSLRTASLRHQVQILERVCCPLGSALRMVAHAVSFMNSGELVVLESLFVQKWKITLGFADRLLHR